MIRALLRFISLASMSLASMSLAALSLVACGSRSPLDEAGTFDEDEQDRPPANGGSGATPSDNGGNGGDAPAPSTTGGAGGTAPSTVALQECVLGPTRAAASAAGVDCNWIVGDRCYERRPEACACACPRDRNSTCVSGSPGSEVGVTCS